MGAVAGLGVLWRYPHLSGLEGSAFLMVYAAAWVLLALPVVLGELALGHGRPRNVVDGYQNSAPRGWGWAGRVQAVGALLLFVLVAVVGGWAGRYAVDAFTAPYADDPAGHFAAIEEGPAALVSTFLFMAGAAFLAVRGFRRGHTPLALVGVPTAILLLVGLATYANFQDGTDASWASYLVPHFGDLEASDYTSALLTALLATGAGTGVLATLAAAHRDPLRLPRKSLHLLFGALALIIAVCLFLIPLLESEGLTDAAADAPDAGYGGFFTTASGLFGAIGGTTGGVLAGAFYLSVVLLALSAAAALLEVPTAYLLDRYEPWPRWRAALAPALVAFAAALPFAIEADRLKDLESFLSGVLGPLAAIALAVRVAYVQRPLLDGLTVGTGRPLAFLLRPWLGYAVPAILLVLALLGSMGFLAGTGLLERGEAGLWRLVP